MIAQRVLRMKVLKGIGAFDRVYLKSFCYWWMKMGKAEQFSNLFGTKSLKVMVKNIWLNRYVGTKSCEFILCNVNEVVSKECCFGNCADIAIVWIWCCFHLHNLLNSLLVISCTIHLPGNSLVIVICCIQVLNSSLAIHMSNFFSNWIPKSFDLISEEVIKAFIRIWKVLRWSPLDFIMSSFESESERTEQKSS